MFSKFVLENLNDLFEMKKFIRIIWIQKIITLLYYHIMIIAVLGLI